MRSSTLPGHPNSIARCRMTRIVFLDIEAIKELYKHVKACKHFRKNYDGEEVQALSFVHDQGLYLMSTGIPHLEHPDKPESSKVVYAVGCHPDEDDEWWDTSCELVGGDDFAEYIPVASFDEIFSGDPDALVINWGEEKYTLEWSERKKGEPALEVEEEPFDEPLDDADLYEDRFEDEDLAP